MNRATSESIIEGIFVEAYNEDGLEYLYTLLRVTGLPFNVPDQLLKLRLDLQEENAPTDNELQDSLTDLLTEDVLELIANLLRLINGLPYTVSPFFDLKDGLGFEPSLIDKIRFLIRTASESGKTDFARLLKIAYSINVIENIFTQRSVKISELRQAYNQCRAFTKALLNIYHQQRLNYRGHQQFTKLPGYQIIELLVDEEHGVYGFYAHFATGSTAHFIRYPDKMSGQNFLAGDRITPFVGLLPFPEEWLVNGKRLHELGLNGRYNQLGEWKPIVYPSLPNKLIQEALASSSDNDVQGSFFYILATGYRVIEFVVQTTVDLPHERCSFGKFFHLWKCPPYESSPLHQNTRIYDGWLELESVDPEYIRAAIAEIGMAVNRMAFAYDANAEWRVKYRLSDISKTLFTPSEEDIHILDSLLRNFPKTEDAAILEASMDWYNRAGISNNIFASFLSYYISIESVASAIADGKADFGISYQRESKAQRREGRNNCIEEKFNLLYASNPTKFISEAYFDCVVGLKKKTHDVAEVIFGAEHPYLALLFEKRDGLPSLSDIRSNLAHGAFSLVDRDQEALVAARLPEIAEIAKEFLTRVIFSLKPDDALPTWSLDFTTSQTTITDPRATIVIVSEQGLSAGDWNIRPEWIS